MNHLHLPRLLRTSLATGFAFALALPWFSACSDDSNATFSNNGAGDGGEAAQGHGSGQGEGGAGTDVSSGGSSGDAGEHAGGEGGAFTKTHCQSALDCRDDAAHPVCDINSAECVACVGDADCGPGKVCADLACVAGQSCKSSLDCSLDQVCDRSTELCVECLSDTDCGAGELCAHHTCRTACASDKACRSEHLLCDLTGGYCTECVSSSDCDPSKFCDNGACQPDRCVAGSTACDGHGVATCAEDGSTLLAPVSCARSQSCVVQGGQASCQNWLCTPDVRSCADNKVMLCASDGLSESIEQTCQATQACVAAACKDVVCDPRELLFCKGSEVRSCSNNGDSSSLIQTCTSSQFCDTTSPACKTKLCTENTAACNGNIATTCNADGSGYKSGGKDCASSNQICLAGQCADLVCPPGERFCENGDVRSCAANGQSSTLYDDCTTSEYCDAASKTCKTRLCTPAAPSCNGEIATTCNADGSGYTAGGVDCTSSSQHCAGGTCQDCGVIFSADFASWTGWTLGQEWQVGPAVTGNGDPGTDHSPSSDNHIAGVSLGGQYNLVSHDYYYLTSPVIPVAPGTPLTLSFFRWLTSDYPPYVSNVVEAFNGTSWVSVWTTSSSVSDTAWTEAKYDLTSSANDQLRIRWGFKVGTGAFGKGGWNIDDVTVSVTCP
jgi:Cys-rich repeat protein